MVTMLGLDPSILTVSVSALLKQKVSLGLLGSGYYMAKSMWTPEYYTHIKFFPKLWKDAVVWNMVVCSGMMKAVPACQ